MEGGYGDTNMLLQGWKKTAGEQSSFGIYSWLDESDGIARVHGMSNVQAEELVE